jgi:ABC-type glycerol-3-phosphate transport system substrate-binding protein
MANSGFTRREFLKAGGGALAGAYVLGLAGCGGGGQSGGPLGLLITGTDDARKEYFAELTRAFQEESGHQVEPSYVGIEQSQQKLTTQVGAGDPPTISYYPGRWLADFADLGALETLDSDVVDGFAESAVEGGRVDGELYGMPWGFSTRALFYRSDLLEQAGLQPPQSWDEMLDAARKMNDPENDVAGFAISGLDHTSTAVQFLIWLWSAGAEVLNEDNTEAAFNSPEGVEALRRYVSVAEEGYAVPGAITQDEPGLHSLFRQGGVAMIITGPWMRALMEEENSPVQLGENAAVMPNPPWETQATLATVDTLSIFTEGGDTEAAMDFLRFSGQDEWVLDYSLATGLQPVKPSVARMPEFADDPLWNDAFIPSMDFAKPYPNVVGWTDVENALIGAVQRALQGEDPQAAMDAAAEQANAALERA